MAFLSLRTPQPGFYAINDGKLYLKTLPASLEDLKAPAYLGLKQDSMFFALETKMSFNAEEAYEEAGLAIVQSDTNHLRFTYHIINGFKRLTVYKNFTDGTDISRHLVSSVDVEADVLYLSIKGHEQELSFYYSLEGETYHGVCTGVDARFLSTEAADGFVDCTMGMYATSNGQLSDNNACFECLELQS